MDSYSTSYPSTYTYDGNPEATAAVAGAFLVIALIYLLFFVALYVVTAIFLGKIFKKANTPAWIAWVPVYNTWRILQLGGQQGWWALVAFIPLVNIASVVFMFIAMYHIGKKLGKDDMFILLAIFLPLVWVIWLGADKSTWDESKGAPRLDTPLPETPTTAAAPAPVSTPEAQQPPVDPTNNNTPANPAA